jgi:hypothetical protein
MLNGAKKTTFDIARISIQEVTFQISNRHNHTPSKFLLHNLQHNVDVFDIFFHLPFPPTPNPRTSPPYVTHTQAIVFKKNVFFGPASIFSPLPLQAKTTYTIFSVPNEILHKLTSCHFILQNKTLNDLYPKILPFSPPRANCTIHQRTVTQIHDLSCHRFTFKKTRSYKTFISLPTSFFFSFQIPLLKHIK